LASGRPFVPHRWNGAVSPRANVWATVLVRFRRGRRFPHPPRGLQLLPLCLAPASSDFVLMCGERREHFALLALRYIEAIERPRQHSCDGVELSRRDAKVPVSMRANRFQVNQLSFSQNFRTPLRNRGVATTQIVERPARSISAGRALRVTTARFRRERTFDRVPS
jgi:hypothetical protein